MRLSRRVDRYALALVLISTFSLSNADAAEPRLVRELKSGVRLYDPPFPRGLYWLDRVRLIFVGVEDRFTEIRYTDKSRVPQPGIYIWNVETETLERYADLSSYANFCYADGYVRYAYRHAGKTILKRGPLGSEKEEVFDGPLKGAPDTSISRLTCREYRQSDYPKSGFGGVFPLRDGDGYIGSLEPKVNHQPKLGYFSIPTAQPIPLPFTRFTNERYLPYFKAYLFKRTDVGRQVVVLFLDGTVREIEIPAGLWLEGSTAFDLSRSGLVMISHSAATETPRVFREENRGAFLVNGDRVEKIASGYISAFEVSPDGCKVAIDIALLKPRRAALQVLNVCANDK
jgi:hypothetical protein